MAAFVYADGDDLIMTFEHKKCLGLGSFRQPIVNYPSSRSVNSLLERSVSLPPAISNGPCTKGLSETGCSADSASLEQILDLTHRLSEEVLCAKLIGITPPERQITTLTIIAIELRKLGIEWPAPLRYALDAHLPPKPEEIWCSAGLGNLTGYIDDAKSDYVGGWALNEGDPLKAVELEILVNGVPVAVVIADLFRADLADLGFGTGYHGFVHRFEKSISSLRNKKITVRRRVDRVHLEVFVG